MQRLVRSVEQGRCPADDFADRAVKYGIGPAVSQLARGETVTSRETLARELTKARDRTLRLVDFDDAELRRQYDPLMSPLVWDLAHIGQQEELWLLRDGNPDRPGMLLARRRPALRRVRPFPRQPGRLCRCCRLPTPARTARRCATRRWTRSTRCPDGHRWDALHVRAGDQPREPARRDDAAGAEPAVRGAAAGPRLALPAGRPGVAGTSVLVPGGEFVLGVDAASEPHSLDNERPRTSSTCPRSGSAGCRSPMANGSSSSTTAATTASGWWSDRGWAHRQQAGLRAPQFWNPRRHPHPVRPRRGHPRRRTRPARHVLRGRGLRGVGGCATAHRGGMGEGVRVGSRQPARGAASRGAPRSPPNIWPISAATRCGRPRSVHTRQVRRPTAPSRCWATCGSGRLRRCGHGPASHR